MATYFAAALSVVSVLQVSTSGGKIFWLFESGYTSFEFSGPSSIRVTMPLS